MPGLFDEFEGTQEELDQLVSEITRLAETGELFDNTESADDLDFVILDQSALTVEMIDREFGRDPKKLH